MGKKHLGTILMFNYLLSTVSSLVGKTKDQLFFSNKSFLSLHCVKTLVEATFLAVLGYGDALYRHASASALNPLDVVYHNILRFFTDDALRHITASCTTSLGGPLSMRGVIYICICLFIKPLLENCLHTYFRASLVY